MKCFYVYKFTFLSVRLLLFGVDHMKVLFFVRDFKAPSVTFIRKQVQLVSEIHEVLTVTVSRQDRYKVDGITCVGIPFQDSFWTNRPMRRLAKWDLYYGFFNPVFGKRLRQIVRDFGPDIIHCQFGPDGILFLDHFPNRTGIPIFIQFRGYDASYMYTKNAYLNRLSLFFKKPWIHPIYVSNHQYERTVLLGLRPNKRRVLYSCTDTDFFNFQPKPIDPKKSTFKFLQVGRMVEVKGHEFTLLAFHRLQTYLSEVDKSAKLVFVGGGELETPIRQKCKELGLCDQVEFIGNASQGEIVRFLKETDFFLHPSVTTSDGRIEGLPNAIMEALAVGVPVIATKHSGMDELLCSDGALFLVEERNVEEFADTMIQLIGGKLSYDLMKSRRMIEEKFSAKQHISMLLDFYEQEMIGN